MTVGFFHDLESMLRRLLWKCTYESDWLYNDTPAHRILICSALECLSKLVGPRWYAERGPPYLLPWHLPNWKESEGGREDFFLLPISAGTVSKEYEEIKHSRPTILLPTRDNVTWFLDVVESFPDLSEETLKQIEWMDKVLDNNRGQFALHSHLIVKAAATAEDDQADPFLRRFLSQTEPPQRIIRSDGCVYDADKGPEGCVAIVPDDDGCCNDQSFEGLDRALPTSPW
ncbi:hypothetical protein QWA68_015699 [Fusarium oxysporum]|nr:hypothetical protein QWA68_015699 [Fusarium oxysporum]